jgi:monovalent cation:H+ antiporter-2, CPA2 family
MPGFSQRHPAVVYWITIVDAQNVAGIAELGVVFLLFLIGLELSYRRLLTMRRLVFGLGSPQVVLSTAAIGGLVALAGHKPAAATIVGASLALSSTAIVLGVLAGQQRLPRASYALFWHLCSVSGGSLARQRTLLH